MEEKPAVFHQQVREAFRELADLRDDFQMVDGSGSIEEVSERVCKVLSEYVNS